MYCFPNEKNPLIDHSRSFILRPQPCVSKTNSPLYPIPSTATSSIHIATRTGWSYFSCLEHHTTHLPGKLLLLWILSSFLKPSTSKKTHYFLTSCSTTYNLCCSINSLPKHVSRGYSLRARITGIQKNNCSLRS